MAEERMKTPEQMHDLVHNGVVWGKGNKMFDTLVRNGWGLNGESNWDGVEMHLRIFGHLPTEVGCRMFSCEEKDNLGREQVGDFIEWLVTFAE